MTARVAGVLLAAGAGRRMGVPKAMVMWDGAPLAERGVRLLMAGGCAPIIAVLGPWVHYIDSCGDLFDALTVPVNTVATGMGASLVAGLDAANTAQADALLVVCVDQPLIGPQAVTAVRTAVTPENPVVAATYAGRRAHPVGLHRSVWHRIRAAPTGDHGARGLVRARRGVMEVACDGRGRPDDVDTPTELAALADEAGSCAWIPDGWPDDENRVSVPRPS